MGPEKHRGCYSVPELILLGQHVPESALAEAEARFDNNDVVMMQYTSGTTGFPKGVMLTHRNILNNGFYIGEGQRLGAEDRVTLPVPFFHCFGCVLGVMACLTHRSTMIIVEDFDAGLVLQAIHKERATAVYGVPHDVHRRVEPPRLRHVRPHQPAHGHHGRRVLPAGDDARGHGPHAHARDHHLLRSYGNAAPCSRRPRWMTTSSTSARRWAASTRRWMCAWWIRTDGHICAPGEPGELCCKGYNVMKGYYKMPEATAEAIYEDGYLHSGDLGMVDEDGYYRVTGRIKDMIIRGGENVYPLEVENFLLTMPGVLDAQVVGIPDARLGEIVGAFIRTRPGHEDMTEEDVRAFAIPRIASLQGAQARVLRGRLPHDPVHEGAEVQAAQDGRGIGESREVGEGNGGRCFAAAALGAAAGLRQRPLEPPKCAEVASEQWARTRQTVADMV